MSSNIISNFKQKSSLIMDLLNWKTSVGTPPLSITSLQDPESRSKQASKQALEAAEKAEIRVSANKRYTREVLIFAVVWPLLYNAYFSSHSLGKHTSASMRLLCFHC